MFRASLGQRPGRARAHAPDPSVHLVAKSAVHAVDVWPQCCERPGASHFPLRKGRAPPGRKLGAATWTQRILRLAHLPSSLAPFSRAPLRNRRVTMDT